MSHLLESDGEIASDDCYNPAIQFMHPFPDGFFKPTTDTMSILYKSSLHHVDLLFEKIRRITDIEDPVVQEEMKKKKCQISKFKEIKSDIQYILDLLAKLHVYASDINVSDYFEIFGNFLKKLLQAWDQFFCAAFRIRFKKNSKLGVNRLRTFHQSAEHEMQSIRRKIPQLRRRIDPVLPLCSVRNEEKIKEELYDSFLIFKLETCNFEAMA